MMTEQGVFQDTVASCAQEAQIRQVFAGNFDDKSWVHWIEDGHERTTLEQEVYPLAKVVCLIRYGNKTVSVWNPDHCVGNKTVLNPAALFIPFKYGLGKRNSIKTASCEAEIKVRSAQYIHCRFPKPVTGFLPEAVPDVEELNLEALANLAKSRDSQKMCDTYEQMVSRLVGEFVFIRNELLPDWFSPSLDNPACLDFTGLIDPNTRVFKTQYVFQDQITDLGFGYGEARKGLLIKKNDNVPNNR